VKLAVAIIFFEKVSQTIDCIKSVANAPIKIYVLNNNSSSDSFDSLKAATSHFNNIIFIDSKENLGPARGRNFLISNIEEDCIFFLDNDITVKTKDWFEKISFHLKSQSNYEVFIPMLYNVHENSMVNFHKYKLANNAVLGDIVTQSETNCFPGGASIVNKSLFTRLGLYNSEISVLEDFEYSIRGVMKNEPIRAKLIDDIVLHHNHKYSKLNKDKAAVKIRYASEQYQFAENLIKEKYKIEYHSGWQQWVNEQMQIMVYSSPYHKIKKKIIIQLRKLKKKYS
jgi:GT2 family glycosyltransferase